MPETIAAAIITAAGATGAAATAITVATYGTFLVGSAAIAKRQQKKALRAAGSQIEDRRFTSRGSAEPHQIVLGRARVGGVQLAPGWSWGTNKENWTVPIAVAAHEVDAIEDIWLGEETGGPWSVSGATLESGIGSKWAPTRYRSAVAVSPGAAAGSVFPLPRDSGVSGVDSIGYTTTNGEAGEGATSLGRVTTYLQPGVHYVYSEPGGAPQIQWLQDFPGVDLVITYRISTADAYFRARRFLGSPAGERDVDLESWSGGEWTPTDLGKAIARVHATFRWSSDIYPSGVPQLSCIVRGVKAYDPRLDSTNGGSGPHRFATPSTWTWTRNPALLWAWYMTWDGGGRRPFARINWPSVITAANVCDETVPLPTGSQPRYQCDGVLGTADNVRSNVDKILSSMVGTRYFSGNQWYVRAGAYVTPTLVLTEDDFAGGEISIRPRPKRRDLFNSVRGVFIDGHSAGEQGASDAGGFYARTDFAPYVSATYVAADGGDELFEDIELPLTTDWRAAQRIAKLMLFRARQALTISARWKIKAVVLQPGDTVWITSPINGWNLKVFRVLDRTHTPHGDVDLVMQEEAAAVYAWNFSEAQNPDPAPNTQLPDPRVVQPLQNFLVSTGDAYRLPDETLVPFATVSWDAVTDAAVLSGGRIEVWWKRGVDTLYRKVEARPTDTSIRIEPVSGGDVLNVWAVAYNGGQVQSPAVFYTVSLRTDLPSGAVVQPLAANRLKNATMLASLDRWSYSAPGIAAAGIEKNAPYAVVGGSSNALLTIADASTGDAPYVIVFQPDLDSIDPTKLTYAAAKLLPVFTSAHVAVQWFDEAQQSIGLSESSNVVTSQAGRFANRREDYVLAALFATPPPGARFRRFWMVAQGAWTSSAVKYLWWLEPMMADVTTALGGNPPWEPGGAPAIGTDLIVQDAATTIYRQTGAAATVTNATDTGVLSMPGPSIVVNASGHVEVSCTFTYELYGGSTNPVTFGATVFPSSTYDPKRAVDTYIATVATGGGPVRGTLELTDMVPVVAGQVVNCQTVINRTAVQSDGPGGVVSKPIGTRTYSANDRLYAGNWKVVHIKR